MSIWYGANVPDEPSCACAATWRASGSSNWASPPSPNAILMAQQGAKAIALDPDPQAIAALRSTAERARGARRVPSGRPRRPRLRHQRVRRPGGRRRTRSPASTTCPVCCVRCTASQAGHTVRGRHAAPGGRDVLPRPQPAVRYGANSRTFSELYLAFDRSNFRIDMMFELNDRRSRDPITPSVLVMRARKQGV